MEQIFFIRSGGQQNRDVDISSNYSIFHLIVYHSVLSNSELILLTHLT